LSIPDADGDGFISLEEFIAFNKTSADSAATIGARRTEDRRTTDDDEDCVKAAFRTFDKDGNDFIATNELHSALLGMGDEAHSLEDCYRMISSFDKDGDDLSTRVSVPARCVLTCKIVKRIDPYRAFFTRLAM
jgi:Ca2+-binding EF-hand superfamily protein